MVTTAHGAEIVLATRAVVVDTAAVMLATLVHAVAVVPTQGAATAADVPKRRAAVVDTPKAHTVAEDMPKANVAVAVEP